MGDRRFHAPHRADSSPRYLRQVRQLLHRAIDFDVAHIRLLYNGIFGYLALGKFMAATHHGYNVLKMPGSRGIITIPYDQKDVMCSLEHVYQDAAVKDSDVECTVLPPEQARA